MSQTVLITGTGRPYALGFNLVNATWKTETACLPPSAARLKPWTR